MGALLNVSRELKLPPKLDVPRYRLGMRLARVNPALMARAVPLPFRIVMHGLLPGGANHGEAWARVIHAAGERPTLAAAREQPHHTQCTHSALNAQKSASTEC